MTYNTHSLSGVNYCAIQNERFKRERDEIERSKFYAALPRIYRNYSERQERHESRLFWEAYERNKRIMPSSSQLTMASPASAAIPSKEYYAIRSAHDSVSQKIKNFLLQTITFKLWGRHQNSKFKKALKANQLEVANNIFQKGFVWKISDKSLKPHVLRGHIKTLLWLVEKEFRALGQTGRIANQTNKMIKDWK